MCKSIYKTKKNFIYNLIDFLKFIKEKSEFKYKFVNKLNIF